MAAVVSRVVLGVCAALAVVGGAALVVMALVYFGADQYVPELQFGGWGILAGMCALAIYAGGVFRAHVIARIALGLALAGAALPVSMSIASLGSLMADPGGPRGNLRDGIWGFIWLLAGAYVGWRTATGQWPVAQQPLSEEER